MGACCVSARLVPHGVDFTCCVYFYILCTLATRLALLGQALLLSNSLYATLYSPINGGGGLEQSDLQEYCGYSCEYCERLTVLADNSHYEIFKHCQEDFHQLEGINKDQGRFYCPSRDRDTRSYSNKRIYMNLEYDGAMNVKEIILGDSSYGEENQINSLNIEKKNILEDIFTPGARQYIYCGDISASLDSALLPVLCWVLVCVLPFLLLTLLHNLPNLLFLLRHPDVLVFANISHFQIGPNTCCWCSCCGDKVRCHKVSSLLSFINIAISVTGIIFFQFLSFTMGLDLDFENFTLSNLDFGSYGAILWPVALSLPVMMGVIGSLRFILLPACFPAVPVYTEAGELVYLKGGQLLVPGHEALELRVAVRGRGEITYNMPHL